VKQTIVWLTSIWIMAIGILVAKEHIPKLEKGEVRFPSLKSYQMQDFDLAWPVHYFEIETYAVDPQFKLKKDISPDRIMQVGSVKMNQKRQKERIWLSKAILKKSYFWKRQLPLLNDYRFTILRFIDKSGHFKAIETLKELRQMLGSINTPAELHLWIFASERLYMEPYSFKKTGKLYRVRFRMSSFCSYEERFRYYNTNGDVIKNKNIRKIVKKNCEEPVI